MSAFDVEWLEIVAQWLEFDVKKLRLMLNGWKSMVMVWKLR